MAKKAKYESDLTDKHKAFCLEYFANGYNATQAYLKIYPDSAYDSAKCNSNRLITNDNIKDYIRELKTNKEEAAGLSWLKIANEFKNIAFDHNTEVRDRLRALEDINKMLGYNEAEKTETTLRGSGLKIGFADADDD